MSRTIAGVLALLGFAAFVVYVAMGQFDAKCEVCIRAGTGTICETALAADRKDAIAQATSSACSRAVGGVTEIVRCTSTPPASVRCEE